MTNLNLEEIESLSIGQLLKKHRQDHGYSENLVALKINLKEKDIKNIENDKFDKLSTNLYLRGVILQYCKIVKLDSKIIKEKLKNLDNVSKNKDNKNKTLNVKSPQNHSPSPKIVLISIVLSIISILFILFYNHFTIKNHNKKVYDFIKKIDYVK